MPGLASDISTQVFNQARQLPPEVWKTLQNYPRPANVILPQALEARSQDVAESLWIVCSTKSYIEFILSVTNGPMGAYPVFIVTTLPFELLTDEYIRPCIRSLVVALARAAHTSRVYSIFSVEPVARIFADEWTGHTGIALAENPIYYDARITYCTLRTLQPPPINEAQGCIRRPAVRKDIEEIGELCYQFASTSQPFTLDRDQARFEAALLVEKKQVWVHEAKGTKEIASIVAFTRNSDRVAAITKVYTSKKWTRQGYAERLVRKVCEHWHWLEKIDNLAISLLTGPNRKESVVLYVADGNKAAIVYDRVGFVGLAEDGQKVEGVDPWLEMGFDRRKVVLGHW
ncbi:hypothetical protein C0993_006365 [Termitomyces sp. T159_Od127]|nr:hypothetical protein C0993_006365 [Termitomyces sp. T159_Od127]